MAFQINCRSSKSDAGNETEVRVDLPNLGNRGLSSSGAGEGEWREGARLEEASQWTVRFADGRQYSGGLLEGLPSGHGVCKWPSGEQYAGDWLKGKRAGAGLGYFPNGEVYDGDWRDDHISLSGEGKLTLANGKVSTFGRT